jgi:hypothetical protein
MTEQVCSQPECRVATSGQCLEGFEVGQCPYFAQREQLQDDTFTYNSQDLVDLPSGEALTDRQAAEVTREDETKLIVIAGPYGSGKTTILTSLFEAFLEAPFANFLFRGSRTLGGFELRCHLGREESGVIVADTSHTSLREGVVFLHLDLAIAENAHANSRHAHLLMSDISGELFNRLRDSSDAVRDIPALARANHLCLAIDGEKLCDQLQRHVARNDSRSILRSIVESKILNSKCYVDVVFTKWDVVVSALESEKQYEVKLFIAETKVALKAAASNFEVRFHEIAARPPKEAKVPFAHGLPTLLRSWMDRNVFPSQKATLFTRGIPSREIFRFTEAVVQSNQLEGQYDIQRF